jgi:hypothetical protein
MNLPCPVLLEMLFVSLLTSLYLICFHQLTVPQIKAEMEKTLQWLVPVATNTTK